MSEKNRFWWFVGISISITFIFLTSIVIIFYKQLSSAEKTFVLSLITTHFAYIFGVFVLITAAFAFALDGIFHNYIIPIHKLAEEITLITSANPSHRIKLEGSRIFLDLVEKINQGADQFENARRNISRRMKKSRKEAEKERNFLVTFLAELPEGVLICNAESNILFYNRKAREFLTGRQNTPSQMADVYVGLGRPVFGIIDKHIIGHALDEISEKIKKSEENITASFMITGKNNKQLRVEVQPVLDHEQLMAGFILICADISQDLEKQSRTDQMLQSTLIRFRSSLASIQGSIEAITNYPEMEDRQTRKFNKIILNECRSLSLFLNDTSTSVNVHGLTHWPLVPILAESLLKKIQGKALQNLGVNLDVEFAPDQKKYSAGKIMVRADSYSMILAISLLLSQLKNATGVKNYSCSIQLKDRFVHIYLHYNGSRIGIELLRKWGVLPLTMKNESLPFTLDEVMRHHGASICSGTCIKAKKMACLHIFMPAADDIIEPENMTALIKTDNRPEFFDFDLFEQPGQNPKLDNCILSELSYTVFDTETTGLNPSGGDEIISIGAARIVNNRLLSKEKFDQLIDPQRKLPRESIKIHGITPEMVAGQPTIDKILPVFHSFCKDTILVAHNAAFDMRMLQIKADSTGVHFINPVLDTLLLAAVVWPAQTRHGLEIISARLGIDITGRHTALGDAIATGEVFLKLIPLLNQAGIHTFRQAIVESKKTYYARLKY